MTPTTPEPGPSFGQQWVAAATPQDIRDMARALAHSPHAGQALAELFEQSGVHGTYYTRDDVAGGVVERIEAIEEYLGRALTDDEIHTVVDGAWQRFSAGDVPDTVYDTLCEDMYGAIWDQVDHLKQSPAAQQPSLGPWETVTPNGRPAHLVLVTRTAPAPGVGI